MMKNLEQNHQELSKALQAHNEWLLIHQNGKTFALQSNETELELLTDKILFGFLEDDGYRTLRLVGFSFEDEKLTLTLVGKFGANEQKIVLIPRVKAELLDQEIEHSRLQRANKIAQLIASESANLKLVRVELNRENGRFAEIVLENRTGVQIAVLSDVSDSLSPEILLTSAILALSKLERRKKKPINEIWIVGERRIVQRLRKIHACLKGFWKNRIILKEIATKKAKEQSKYESKMLDVKPLQINGLWRFKPKKIILKTAPEPSTMCLEISKLSPDKIDHIFSANGETLRYLGMPFLRVREMLGEEKTWFGTDQNRRTLNDASYEDFYKMFKDIERYRSFDSPNRQHIFYQSSPEAWLESVLRRNIKLLDPNLILSPIYNQFRTSRDKIDLLALRKDGRLVIIELKVAADREMIFQAVDYWRKIELQRKKGILNDARLFGDKEIANEPAVCYLVAPTLSFHKSFKFLAKTISTEIELIRFDLAENWREEVKVLERRRVR